MRNKSIKISIVIPAFNEGENIRECVRSLKAQDFPKDDFEIIAVDNNSTDDTLELIKTLDIPYTVEYTKGPAAAKNAGIKMATGNIIAFVDGDCVADGKWLKEIVTVFKDSNTGCVAGEIMAMEHENMSHLEQFLIKKGHLSQNQHVKNPFLPFAATANAAYRKEVFEKIGLFDEALHIGEDADMSWRMQLKTNYKLTFSSSAVVSHPYETSLKALFRQKQRHACGGVALYKKYRHVWPQQERSLKTIYWEYHSIAKRLLKFMKDYLSKDMKNLDESHFQTILESGWKFGLIVGSLKHRVWYI